MADTNQMISQAKQFWLSRTSNQRIVLGVGAAAVIGLVTFFANLLWTPDYKPLLSGLEAADAQSISSDLAAKKIAFQVSPDGKSISVPADQVDAARLVVSGSQTTHSGRMGFEIFDKVSWGQTEFDERVNYQRALEGELERTILTLGGVRSSRVHLVMPTESVFLERERSAKASVTLKLGRGGLTREETRSIQRLVAGAVDGLKPSDVSIIDADSHEALGGGSEGLQSEEGVERLLSQRLIATLVPVVGNDHLRASVNVEYDPSTTEESQDKYDPAVSVPLSIQKSDEQTGPGAGVGGVPGTTSNVPQGKANVPPPASEDTTQTSKTENATYGVNKTTRHSMQPAGRVRRITAAVLVDDVVVRKPGPNGKSVETRLKRSPLEMQQIQLLATNAIGLDSARGDVISVQNLAFTHADEVDVPPVSVFERARKGVADYSTVVRYAMLLILFTLAYVLMIRPMQKKVLGDGLRSALQPALSEPSAVAALPLPGAALEETTRSLALKEQLIEQVKAEPAGSARAVQAWLRGSAE